MSDKFRKPSLDETSLRQAAQNFEAMDKNGDGTLSLEEFQEGLGMVGVDKGFCAMLFDAFDKDGSKSIDRREFIASMSVMIHPDNTDEQVALAFDAYDLNKDGRLDRDELRQVIRAIFSTLATMGVSHPTEDADARADELFSLLDEQEKGYVTKEDYLKLAHERPGLLKHVGLGVGAARASYRQSRQTRRDSIQAMSRHKGGGGHGGRKRGVTVAFGHRSWERVLQMMVGIRTGLTRCREREAAEPAHPCSAALPPVEGANGGRCRARTLPERPSFKVRPGVAAPVFSLSSLSDRAFDDVGVPAAHFDETDTFPVPSHGKGGDVVFKDYSPRVFRRGA
jgi:Ca2+-binding EF-hand superfamily protein